MKIRETRLIGRGWQGWRKRGPCGLGELAMLSIFLVFGGLDVAPLSAWQTAATEWSRSPDFVTEELYKVPREQGSWVSLTVDPQGRLIASDQYGSLYRVTVGAGETPPQVETIPVKTGRAHGLLYAFDSLYVMSHQGDGQPSGLYRVRDTDGDDVYDNVELLREIAGEGEHGPHAIVLSPDGESLYICAGNHTQLPELSGSRVPRVWNEDQVVARMWDANGHAAGILAPGGWICRVDRDGRELELISMGYRNQYDIAFDTNGELFTYDADMEWDIGLPWYRPTRVCHAVPGSEFGWRSGTGKWPVYFPDNLPPVVDIGPGSPTGVVFGTGAKFPAKYQRALYIADWSYGAIYACHLTPNGSSYGAETEVFATGPGMAVTDMAVNPRDGAFYFLIGGRRSQSALYRVSYRGSESTAAVAALPLEKLALERRKLEELLVATPAEAAAVVEKAWPYLGHSDRFLRFTARTAIERMPWAAWRNQWRDGGNIQARLEGALMAARCGDEGTAGLVAEHLRQIPWSELDADQQLHWLRTAGVLWARHHSQLSEQRADLEAYLAPHFPAASGTLNLELARLLCGLNSRAAIETTLNLMQSAKTQEEQIHYAFCLRVVTEGWTLEQRQAYFQWFLDAGRFRGGNSFAKFLMNARAEAANTLSSVERESLGELVTREPARSRPDQELAQRPVVANWTMESLPIAAVDLQHRDLENGRRMFSVGQCNKCHRLAGEGGSVGPDLTPAGRRFSPRDLLETLIVPSREVSDQYQATMFQLEDGRTVIGRIANLSGDTYMVQTDLYDPGNFTNLRTADIVEMRPAATSMMPTGLLDSMTRDDILDLMAYLRAVADEAFDK